ncbi:MAG: lysylphosphatidylglycerol synthase transmembrane domain-containing protein [Candidatus Aerophobetes bacterium]|nr:lysylphosphatidylglycerol synthase transmembrane domain-containing protein [Candidatus Aerophobetes bacterium]
MKRKVLIFIIGGIAGSILLVLIFYFIGIQRVFFQVGEVGFLGASIFLLNAFVVFFIDAISWQVILKSYGYRLPFRDVLTAKLVGIAIGYLTPSMYIGGEPVRAYMTSKKHNLSITSVGATVIVNKFLELSAGLVFIYLGSIWVLMEYPLPWQLYLAILTMDILFGLGMGFIFVNFIYENKIFTSLVNFLGRAKPLSKIIRKIEPKVSEIEDEVFLAFNQHKRATIFAFFLNIIAGFLIFLKPVIFFYFLRILLKLSQLSLLFALTHLLLAFQFTPAGVGIFEIGAVGIYKLVGIQANKALAYTLMNRISDSAEVGIAAFLAADLGLKGIFGSEK